MYSWVVVLAAAAAVVVAAETDPVHRGIAAGSPGPWTADLFHRALANFTVREDVGTPACRIQTRTYVRHLMNNTYWAVKMYDSWNQYPKGILAGATKQMGVYEECINVHLPVQGQYCLAAIKLDKVGRNPLDPKGNDELQSFDNAWDEILEFHDYQYRYPRNELKIGICIPESCTAANLEVSLQDRFDKIFLPHRVQPKVTVEPILCSTDKNTYPQDTGYYVTRITMYMVSLICCLSTLYHLFAITRETDAEKKKNIPEFVYWFSIIHNGRSLIKYDKNSDLNILNGVKVLTMVLILFGHKFLFFSLHPLSYAIKLEEIYKKGPDILLTCMNLVDPFFFITSYLTYILVKPQLSKRGSGWVMIPKIIIYKYLRMIPAYGTVMLLTVYFIPHLYNGPFWASKMWPEAEKCKNYWWANFLAISNFMEVDHQCLIFGWYISCLFQFLIIGVIITYICAVNQKIGTGIISVLLSVSLAVPFIMTYITRSYGLIRVIIPFLENPGSSYEFSNLYMPFYVRAIPFFAGLLAAIMVEELKNRKFKMSKVFFLSVNWGVGDLGSGDVGRHDRDTPMLAVNIFRECPLSVYGWTFGVTVVCFWVQYYAVVFYERHRPYNVIEQAAYATLSHCTWTTMLFCICVCHFTSGYGPFEKVFNNRLAVFLGRLSYSVYLVNIPVMMVIEYRQNTPVAPNTEILIDGWIVGAYRAYLVGLVLYLFVEAPCNTIIKTIFFGNKNNSSKKTVKEFIPERMNSTLENVQTVSHL